MSKRDTAQEQEEPKKPKFEGFQHSNTTPIPDVLFDELLTELTGTQIKVLLYIMRRTWGFKKDTDAISLSQFQKGITTKDGRRLDKGCGVDDRKTITRTLGELEKNGYIKRTKKKTSQGDDDTTTYTIRFKDTEEVGANSNHQGRGKIHPRVGANSPRPVGANSNPQETVIQETDLQETEKITAQSPIGSVLNVSSSSPIHTQEDEPTPPTGLQQKLENFTPKRNNPRPSASPKEEKNTPPQSKQATKQSIDPDKLEQAKATIQREIGGRMIWESRDVSSVKKMLEQGATCEEIGIVIRGIKADPFQRKNLTVSYISRQFGNQLSQASLSIPADPSTQEDKHSRYDDPNFDPRMLSNTESIEYKSWLAAHEPIKP